MQLPGLGVALALSIKGCRRCRSRLKSRKEKMFYNRIWFATSQLSRPTMTTCLRCLYDIDVAAATQGYMIVLIKAVSTGGASDGTKYSDTKTDFPARMNAISFPLFLSSI